jgi:glycosyltransferase involved in cell wall biosynthesis
MTQSSGPLISIITATWNCAPTVAECLASVAEQTWPHREHIVVDGASTDGTLEVLQAHETQLAALLSEPDSGIYDALNKGLALAGGDVIGFLHADDFYTHPNALAHVAKAFMNPSVCAVYGDLHYVRRQDVSRVVRHWSSKPFKRGRLAWGWMPPHPTLFVRREWYQRIGGFDTRYRISADYLSILGLFSQPGFKAVYLPEVLVTMRLGGASNRSLLAIARKTGEDWCALRQTKVGALGGTGALFWKNLSKLAQFRGR